MNNTTYAIEQALDSSLVCILSTAQLQSVEANCPYSAFNPCVNACIPNYYPFGLIREAYLNPLGLFLFRFIHPVLVLLTVITNILVVLILSQKHMRSPTNTVLLSMAIADLFVALVPFPFFFLYIFLGRYNNHNAETAGWCKLALYTNDVLPPFCHNVAIWLTVLLAVQRTISIRYPHQATTWCTVGKVRTATIIIIVVSLVFASQKFFDVGDLRLLSFSVYNASVADGGVLLLSEHTCVMSFSIVVKYFGENWFFSFYYWCRGIFFSLIPSVILVVFMILLIHSIQEARRRKARLLKQKRTFDAERQRESNSTTTMLVLVSIIFLIVNLPQSINLGIFCLSRTLGFYIDEMAIIHVSNIDNMLILLTYPINFAIYCSMSKQFRDTFKAIICKKRDPEQLTALKKRRSFYEPLSKKVSSASGQSSRTKRNGGLPGEFIDGEDKVALTLEHIVEENGQCNNNEVIIMV